ncbi:MAG TPA: hydroxymethylglutaryl-CoA reductase, degradative [Anaerolineae bacterium]|nr:hydroxymethylglutaryl-CoA reductase, degradative [Anaerolineae bacterium]
MRREMEDRSSRLPEFYKKSPAERLQMVAEWADLEEGEIDILRQGLSVAQGDKMIENTVATHGLPLGIASNFLVNGRDYLVPMVIEEPSVVAGASYAARLARAAGGFQAESTEPEMIGQIQVLGVSDLQAARQRVMANRDRLLALANELDPVIVRLGGGARDVEVRLLEETAAGPMLILHLIYDCRDAMGANVVNTACEALAPHVEGITGGRVRLRILSNLADRRLVQARAIVPIDALARPEDGLSGEEVAQGIVEAWAFADADPYRAATHNKGVMNGIDAVVIATGNDWRAVEAGAHAYAARAGRYTSLTRWGLDGENHLLGSIELPLAVGIVGGATRAHPTAKLSLKILGVKSGRELAEVIAAVGLAQNLAAIRALAAEGIQRGHMRLHARQVATAAGATDDMVDRVAARLVAERQIRPDRAAEILAELASGKCWEV